jgi:sarcosine oxidase
LADSYDVVVVGAGVFGAWTAHQLRRSGRSVALLDAYGAGNSRASSGDESRISRIGYGADEIYTRWARGSLEQWIDLFERLGQPQLFQNTGVLWTAPPEDPRTAQTLATLDKCGGQFQRLSPAELSVRYPQFRFSEERTGIFEPGSGVLLARRAVQAVVEEAVRNGVAYFRASALAPVNGTAHTTAGQSLHAGAFVYACGPWLPKSFPGLLTGRIRPTRQEIFYFGTPAGDRRFTAPDMPAWIDFSDARGPYGLPDIESRGIKLGFDQHGAAFDPDSSDRLATGVGVVRAFLAVRFPALADAPLVESRVCQYENTSTGDFLIDQHPDFPNVWLVGGGSGHGFKHGPMVGEYVTGRMDGSIASEPRFSLATKSREEERTVY